MLAYSDLSEEEEAPYAYWETKSILELHGAPPPPRVEAATLAPLAPPRRPSQRSGAPSPSLAVTANGTPKLKRTTTNASLPSPSGSAILADDAKALRQKKRRKPTAGKKRRAAAAQPEPSSEPFDAKTLEALSQLARKIQARATGHGSPALGRTRAASVAAASAAGHASAAPVPKPTTRSPLRQATITIDPPDRVATTPLRQTPARAARTKPAGQTLLNLSATKAGRTRNSPSAGVGKSPAAKSATASPARRPPPPSPPVPAAVKPAAITPIKPLPVSKVEEEEEDYFDDDDFSFEAALSQLDVDSLLPNGPPPAAPVPSTSQLSDTLKDDSPAAGGGVVVVAPMPRTSSTTRPVSVPPPGFAAAKSASTINSTSKPLKPATGQINRPIAPVGIKPSKGVPLVRTTTSGSKLKSAAELSALQELARKEIAALAELDGVDLFGDDDDPF
ncbi:hypothetical protein B0A53_04826 [Rhodotorula sp. CCFEE 5036]|nr:hypothetical protein B0A53_04826 [Rhodotorula sp. CCFEE 5036]